jgi:uncharacterized protein with PIN domain
VEIISRGTPPEEKPHEATCRNCSTQIRFLRREAKYISDQRDGDYLEVTCPVCSRTIFASTRAI